MLDKSVPYAGVFMRRPAGAPLVRFPLPEGYTFAFYQDGDDAHWARIETAVLEFDGVFAALLHFRENFLPHARELYRRCVFIKNADGECAATATAWWEELDGVRYPWLHWVAVMPGSQGAGLGKALASYVVELMSQLEGKADFYLHSQTWSYKAINIYRKLGFEITHEKLFYRKPRDNWRKAERILRSIEKKHR